VKKRKKFKLEETYKYNKTRLKLSFRSCLYYCRESNFLLYSTVMLKEMILVHLVFFSSNAFKEMTRFH